MRPQGLSERLVGRSFEISSLDGSRRCLVLRAHYNPLGETVLVLHLEDAIGGIHNEVLIGRAADTVVASFDEQAAA